MNNSTYRFTLDLQKHNSQMSVAVYKYDNAVRLYISLTDGGKPYTIEDGSYAIFYGKRADGKPLIHKCEVKDNTEITYDFKNSTAYVEGIVESQIRLYKDQKLITAPRFTIVVEERVVTDDDIDITIEDDDRYSGVDAIFADEEARAAAEELRNEAEWARVIAEDARKKAEQERKSVWVRYSAYPDGTGYSETWREGLNYIGVATSHDYPSDKSAYKWSLFKGDRGNQGEKGDPGEPFKILKQYTSIALMNADFANKEVPKGGFVMIDTGKPNEVDNGKLYVKGDTSFTYITDMSEGIQGADGKPGKDGISATHSWDGTKLTITSASGTSSADLKGDKGDRGSSAYDIARVVTGFKGTEQEWLDSLKGESGKNGNSAYQIARANGFKGSEQEWLDSLKGKNGADGLSAYQIACANGFEGTILDWVNSHFGEKGEDGTNGKSAFEIACGDFPYESEAEWLRSLQGKDGTNGKSAFEIAKENGYEGDDEIEWLASLHGDNGADGKSAYEVALEGGYEGSEEEWLNFLKGDKGNSAYDVACANGFKGTEEEWLKFLALKHSWDGTTLSITSASGTTYTDLKGDSAYKIACEKGFEGTEEEWLDYLNGFTKQIMTTNGEQMRVFVGTHDEYDAYVSVYGEDNLFAIFTDEDTAKYQPLLAKYTLEPGQKTDGSGESWTAADIKEGWTATWYHRNFNRTPIDEETFHCFVKVHSDKSSFHMTAKVLRNSYDIDKTTGEKIPWAEFEAIEVLPVTPLTPIKHIGLSDLKAEDVYVGYKATYPFAKFNRTPVVGETFTAFCRTGLDNMSLHIYAKITEHTTSPTTGEPMARFEILYFSVVENVQNALMAEKATQDGDGNVIAGTYATKAALTTETNRAKQAELANATQIDGILSGNTAVPVARRAVSDILDREIYATYLTITAADEIYASKTYVDSKHVPLRLWANTTTGSGISKLLPYYESYPAENAVGMKADFINSIDFTKYSIVNAIARFSMKLNSLTIPFLVQYTGILPKGSDYVNIGSYSISAYGTIDGNTYYYPLPDVSVCTNLFMDTEVQIICKLRSDGVDGTIPIEPIDLDIILY